MKLMEFARTTNIAHRGARSLAPENTLSAARLGLESGADAWELDVAVTADSELVILHDNTLARTSNVAQIFPGRSQDSIHTFTLAELRQLDFGSWYNHADPFQQIAAGVVTQEMQQSYVGEPVLTLADALNFTHEHNWQVNIEIKNAAGTPADSFVVEKVVRLVQDFGMEDSVMISSFNHDYLRRVRALTGQIATAPIVAFPVPDPVQYVRELGANGYNPGGCALVLEEIPRWVKAGVYVMAWTINNADSMRELIKAGVSSICSDFPQLCAQVLAAG